MEFVLSFPIATTATIFAFLVFLYHLLSWLPKRKNGHNKKAPQAPGAWPIIGHLHLLGGSELLPQKTLGSMADKYGPIFTIKIGVHEALVVNDWKTAKECFTTNDQTFANRPKTVAVEVMGYNYAMFGFGPYTLYWRKIRRMAMVELLSNSRLEILGHIRIFEIKASVNGIYEFWRKTKSSDVNAAKMEMKEWFGSLILKVIVRMLFSVRYSNDEEEHLQAYKGMRKFLKLVGMFVVADAIPYLRWLDLGGHEKAMKETAVEIDCVLESWLNEHKRKRKSGQDYQDFMGVMLSILEGTAAEDLGGYDADSAIKATCLQMLAAAADTTTVTIVWALSLLLNNRHVLKKAQDELDVHVGRERQVEDSDMKNLVYLQAIVKETMRLYPAVPLNALHESMDDCVVDGYNIPKGTRLVANLWKIQRDPNAWPEPSEFRPERFFTTHKDINIWGQDFELIPFGSGRRMCPGVSLSLQILHLTLASLIQGFEMETPSDEPIDMTESFGLTNLKATPLEVLLTPRLSPNLYELVDV